MGVSRFTDEANGKKPRIEPADVRYLELLDPEFRYSVLPWNWAYELLGRERGEGYFRHRSGYLARQPHKYLHKPEGQWFGNALAKTDCYQRGPGGDAYLLEHRHIARPSRKRPDHIRHQIMDNLAQASIELGAMKSETTRFVGWRTLMDLKPEKAKNPHTFKLSSLYTPDGAPFALSNEMRDIAFIRETDTGSLQQSENEIKGSTNGTKIRLIKELFEKKAYREHYGFERMMVLYITKSELRTKKIKKMVAETIGSCSYILFASAPAFDDVLWSAPPSTNLFDEPWTRVGHPPFSLATLSDA